MRPPALFVATVVLAAGLIPVLGLACAGEAGAPAQPPQLPPLPQSATLDVDLGFFLQPPSTSDSPGDTWWYSAGRVADARGVTEPVLKAPHALLQGASGGAPALERGAWHWRFAVEIEGAPYTSDMTGRVDGGESVWEVRVTAPNHGVVNLVWYAGRARLDGTAGIWRVYHVQSQPEKELASVVWSHPEPNLWTIDLDEHGLLRPGETTHAEYRVSGNARTMTYATVFTSGTNEFEARWDTVRRDGSLITPVYNSGQRVCWGNHLENVTCPP